MTQITRHTYVSSLRGMESPKDVHSKTIPGQAYEVSALVQRYVQGNPPDVRVNNSYSAKPDIDAPRLMHPFGGDPIDYQEDIALQKGYANTLLDKDKNNARAKELVKRAREKSVNNNDVKTNTDVQTYQDDYQNGK